MGAWTIIFAFLLINIFAARFIYGSRNGDYCGKTIIGNEWVYGRLRWANFREEAYILFDDGSMVEVLASSVRYSTSRKDRLGRDIYTDDQCKLIAPGGEEHGRIEIKNNDTWFKSRRIGKMTRLDTIESQDIEITDSRCYETAPETKQIEGGGL